jgi:hypothetical protein
LGLTVSFPCDSSKITKGRGLRVLLHNGKQQRVVVGGNAGGGLINEGNRCRGARLERVWSCAARSSWARTPGLSGAGHKWRRHGANDIGKATNGSSGEAEKTKKAKLETTSADNTIAQRKEGNGSGNIGVCGSSGDSSNGGASSTGRDKDWRRREGGFLTWFSWGCAQMATYFALAGEAR